MNISLGIDVGTTGIKSVLIREDGTLLASVRRQQRQFFPHSGWVEQDPEEILALCLDSCRELLAQHDLEGHDIACIGIDHQGESTLVWEKSTGRPLYPVITWQDRRMDRASEQLGRVYGEEIEALTGLRSDSYYSAWKIRWILDHIEDGQQRAQRGELLAGTLNTWLIWNFTARSSFVTDESSTNVMMLSDPRITGWNDWLLALMQIPKIILPEILPCNALLGSTDPALFGASIPITASLADSSAGVVALGAFSRGEMTVTYGTGNFMHLITGDEYIPPSHGLTASCCFSSNELRLYQLNGICYTAGSAINWLKNGIGLLSHDGETEELARSVPDAGGVLFVPALHGLATPFWDQSARGAFFGLSDTTTPAHMVRAVLESFALQVAHCSLIMNRASGITPTLLNAMGGMTSNRFLMQLQADLSQTIVSIPLQTEPAYGAACMALWGIGRGPSPEDLKVLNPPMDTYYPAMTEAERMDRIERWISAAERTTAWYPHDKT